MRTVGLIGGLSWHSTLVYYRRINELVQRALGGNHSADLLLRSVDFRTVELAQIESRWDDLAAQFVDHARVLESAGATGLAICANTMHKVVPQVASGIRIPILSIFDSTAAALKTQGLSRAALLGTRTTMGESFYRSALEARGIHVVVPSAEVQERIHAMIHHEVMAGVIDPATRRELVAIIEQLAEDGVQAAILGCTELPLLVSASDTRVPLVDTLEEHARVIAEFALDREAGRLRCH